jgi:outer membrane lipoprotein SlyB
LLGALAGGLGGNAIEHQTRHAEGIQIVVRLDNGRSVAVLQPGAGGVRRGDRVRIIGDGREARVERA